jgi:hypothetical protein
MNAKHNFLHRSGHDWGWFREGSTEAGGAQALVVGSGAVCRQVMIVRAGSEALTDADMERIQVRA